MFPPGIVRLDGGFAVAESEICVVVLPYWFVAVIVNVVCGNPEVGVPVIAQVVGFKTSPSGKAGEIVQEVMLPVNVGVMFTEEPTVKVVELVPELVV